MNQMRVHLPRPARVRGWVDRGSRRHRVLQRAGRQGTGVGGRVQAGFNLRDHQAQFRVQVPSGHGKPASW